MAEELTLHLQEVSLKQPTIKTGRQVVLVVEMKVSMPMTIQVDMEVLRHRRQLAPQVHHTIVDVEDMEAVAQVAGMRTIL